MAQIIRWREFDDDSEKGFRQYKTRVYPIGDAADLSTNDLQEGDTLPDDSTYEIISAEARTMKRQSANHKGQTGRVCRVIGYKEKILTAKSGAGAWNELYDSRRVIDTDPQNIRYEIRFSAVISDSPTRPSNGDSYATINGGASGFPTTGVDREPVAVHVSEVTNATILLRHVTVVFQSFHARTATGSPGTEINPRVRVRTGRNSWKGRMRFSAPVSSAAAIESALYGSTLPGTSGKYAAKCIRVETFDEPPNMPGRSLLVASYETPRIVGEGKLRIEVGTERVVETKDLKDQLIVGIENQPGKSTRNWERKIISGSNIRLVPNTIIILETAATAFNVNTIMNRVGHVNKYMLPNFGNAQPGTLLFLGAPNTTFDLVGDLWYLNLAVKYSGDPATYKKWNDRLVSQPGNYFPVQQEVVDKDGGLVVGSVKSSNEWRWNQRKEDGSVGITTSPLTHDFYPESDFRDIGKRLVITGI